MEMLHDTNYGEQSDEKLVQLWKDNWRGSQTSFCRMYELNQGNFNAYCKGKRQSNLSRNAIITFLQGHQDGKQPSVKWTTVLEYSDVIKRAGASILPSKLNKVIWIDGDNSAYFLKHIKENAQDSLVFFVYLKDRCCTYTRGLDDRQEFVFVHSISSIKDSADIAITLLATQLNTITPSNVEYVFVSKDHFVQDLFVFFSAFRTCKIVGSLEDF